MTGYISVDDASQLVGLNDATDLTILNAAIEAASRQIESQCQRSFFQDDAVSLRKFRPDSSYSVPVDDISTVSGLIVAVDSGDTGTASETWTVDTDFFLEPSNVTVDGVAGWPYTTICTTTARSLFPYNVRPSVHVTAQWGWAAIPDAIAQACGVLTEWLFKMKDAPLGVAGYGDFGAIRVREHPVVTMLLAPYVRRAVLVA